MAKQDGDFVKHGSEEHAALLGLTEAPEGESLVYEGWTLADSLGYGAAATEEYLMRVLRGKVNELTTTMPKVQTADRRKPGYAPEMWVPVDEPRVTGIV